VKRPRWSACGAALLLTVALIVAAPPMARATQAGGDGFDVYRGTLDLPQWQRLAAGGVDVDEITRRPVSGGKVAVQVILGRHQAARLTAAGRS